MHGGDSYDWLPFTAFSTLLFTHGASAIAEFVLAAILGKPLQYCETVYQGPEFLECLSSYTCYLFCLWPSGILRVCTSYTFFCTGRPFFIDALCIGLSTLVSRSLLCSSRRVLWIVPHDGLIEDWKVTRRYIQGGVRESWNRSQLTKAAAGRWDFDN